MVKSLDFSFPWGDEKPMESFEQRNDVNVLIGSTVGAARGVC